MTVQKTILKETKYIALGMVILSALMNAVFLILNQWSYHVLLSNLLIGSAMILHFFLLGLTVQKACAMSDQDNAQKMMKFSQMMRLLMVGLILIVGMLFSEKGITGTGVFSFWALVPPLFFNRITLLIRSMMIKNEKSDNSIPDNSENKEEEVD